MKNIWLVWWVLVYLGRVLRGAYGRYIGTIYRRTTNTAHTTRPRGIRPRLPHPLGGCMETRFINA